MAYLRCPSCKSKDYWEWYYKINELDNYPISAEVAQCKLCGTIIRRASNVSNEDWYVFIPPDNPWKRKFTKYVHRHKNKRKKK